MELRFGLLCLSAFAVFFLAACGQDAAPTSTDGTNTPTPVVVPATGPAITAAPNPVPAGSAPSGTTTIAWNTGGGLGEVYLSTNGSEEKLFAQSSDGSQVAPWIEAGSKYEFRLYGAGDRSKPLASVTVTRNR